MECPSCSRDIAEDARFCPFCGLHVAATRPGHDETAIQGGEPADEADAGPREERTGSRDPAELASCPRCGAPNSPQRVLCGRCGADLETGSVGVVARAPSPSDPVRDGRRSSRRTWLVVVVLGALIGSAVGLVFWSRTDRTPGGAEEVPTFDRAAYPDDTAELQVVQVSASSQLSPEGSISYEPGLAIDGDPRTAWNEGAEGTGEGESLQLQLAQDSWVTALVLRNGYQKDDQTYFDNARASRLLVRFGDGSAFVVEVQDRSGAQIIRLPDPVHTSTVTLEVLDAIPGEHYQDLAISEVSIRGWPAQG